jgi:hypothetical protein
MSFELHSGASGTYVWSSHVTRFASLTPVEKQSIPKYLASFIEGVAPWHTAAEFRAFVTMVHEVAHYFQDLTTGMGMWDFLKQRDNAAKYFGFLREAKAMEDCGELVLMRLLVSQAQDLVGKLSSECVFVPTRDYPAERRAKLQAGMGAILGKPVSDEDAAPLLVENMLESEAAAVTFYAVRNLGMTDEQWEIARDNGSLWSVDKMSPLYTETFQTFLSIFERWMGAPIDELRQHYGEWITNLFYRILILMLDLCWAYPDPDQFANGCADRSDYDPGLKLMRLLAGMQNMNSAEAGEFQQAMSNNLDAAEALLIAKCGFSYPPAQEVYRGWAAYLDKLRRLDDNRLLRAYREACEVRQKDPDLLRNKHLGGFFSAHIDLHYMANGIRTFWTSHHFLEPDETGFVIVDLMSLNRELRLTDYLTGRTPFICPLAEARICDAARDTCKTGITTPEQFPAPKECSVRNSLVTNGLPLRRLQ